MRKIIIDNIRNIAHMEFELPAKGLHIVTGKNGSGKTTLFTCLSRICNGNAYRTGFLSSKATNFDQFNGTISYVIDSSIVKYTRREDGKWRPDVNGDIFTSFGYTMVAHITTKNERVFTQEIITPRRSTPADIWIKDTLNSAFETTKFSDMIQITVGDLRGRGNGATRRRNSAFAIPSGRNRYFSEQNFSFGEIVLLNLLYDIERIENNSLVLIDELEMALHPSAQIRLIARLEQLASDRNITIIISTHSSSIIRSRKTVILLEPEGGNVQILPKCPPAKAIGAIGMREDSMPDIIVLVEDIMAKSLFNSLLRKYLHFFPECSYLDIRILPVGGFANILSFYQEANNYVFYDNVYVTAYLDKDVETDILPYSLFGNRELVTRYSSNRHYIKSLPFTPEVLLCKTFYLDKNDLLHWVHMQYCNHQVSYTIDTPLDFSAYEAPIGPFSNQAEYNAAIEHRGAFRGSCKTAAEKIANCVSDQLNISTDEVYRFVFQFSVDRLEGSQINVRELLATTMKRIRCQNQ